MFAGQDKSCSNEKINWIHNKKLPITVRPHETVWSRTQNIIFLVCTVSVILYSGFQATLEPPRNVVYVLSGI
jgi:hypothetical protein